MVHEHEAYCQPCVSPVWDTGLTCHTLLEVGDERAVAQARKGLDWLVPKQILEVKGDWVARRPDVRPGGWAFQYANPHYPDVDDTAVVVMAMDRVQGSSGRTDFNASIARASEWILGLQSQNGAWGAFDADNEYHYLNNIPFADHGALLDPPTEDVTARCVSMLAQLGETAETSPAVAAGIGYLRRTQLADGSWYGRWGMNYIYGTWSVLCALNAAGVDHGAPEFRKAVAWLARIQNPDGGWGEDGTSYKLDYRGYEAAPSTASQTAWALLGLMAAGEVDHPAVARGIEYLARTQGADGLWNEELYTATGFPRVFYLRYHGYREILPALGAGALPQPEERQCQGGGVRDVMQSQRRRAGANIEQRARRSHSGTAQSRFGAGVEDVIIFPLVLIALVVKQLLHAMLAILIHILDYAFPILLQLARFPLFTLRIIGDGVVALLKGIVRFCRCLAPSAKRGASA